MCLNIHQDFVKITPQKEGVGVHLSPYTPSYLILYLEKQGICQFVKLAWGPYGSHLPKRQERNSKDLVIILEVVTSQLRLLGVIKIKPFKISLSGALGWYNWLSIRLLVSWSQGHGREPCIAFCARWEVCLRFSPFPSAPPAHASSVSVSLSL